MILANVGKIYSIIKYTNKNKIKYIIVRDNYKYKEPAETMSLWINFKTDSIFSLSDELPMVLATSTSSFTNSSNLLNILINEPS